MMHSASRGIEPVYFCFADPVGFSGQKAATELVIDGLAGRGWKCLRLAQPVLDRGGKGGAVLLRYLFALARAWLRAIGLLGVRNGWLCVNLGQTRAGFVRDSVPLALGWARWGRERVVVSLHGSLFMEWHDDSLEVWVFRFLLRSASVVTVLGERQRARLIALGLPDSRVVTVVNSCNLTPASPEMVATKHRMGGEVSGPVRCLFLSSLIDTKGFPEYLEALALMSNCPGPEVEAVLCGPLVASEFSSRFREISSASDWIENQIERINRSGRVRARWIKGAAGADKVALFNAAEIFVLPTHYAVEAQPLVLLEAMASGCAIVTTRAGEICTILDEESAFFLEPVSAGILAEALEKLALDPPARLRLAQAAHARFLGHYQIERHLDTWERLLTRASVAEGLE